MMRKALTNGALTVLLFCAAVAPARAAMTDYPVVKLQSLDKATARTTVFEARVGSTVRFGPLYIRTQACRKAPPIEKPEAAAFLQIWEVTPKDESQWIFSGWMFASSPALSSMNHAVYDVWVIDCLDGKTGEAAAASKTAGPEPVVKTDETGRSDMPTDDSEAPQD